MYVFYRHFQGRDRVKIRTPIIIPPQPPPTEPQNKRCGSKVRLLTGHVFSREELPKGIMAKAYMCLLSLLPVAGMMKQTVHLEKTSFLSFYFYTLTSQWQMGWAAS